MTRMKHVEQLRELFYQNSCHRPVILNSIQDLEIADQVRNDKWRKWNDEDETWSNSLSCSIKNTLIFIQIF